MLTPPFGFDDIMAPLGAERFLAEYEGKKPLHLKGAADKFAEVMAWSTLNDLLGQATIWSQQSLKVVLDRQPVPPASYCDPAVGRDGGQVLRPDPDKVKEHLRRGATLVANDIDHLTAGLTQFAAAMEAALRGKVQGNLYLSSKRRQGFDVHFDTHDVYAVHVEGTKTWYVYAGRATEPIAHPMFKTLSQDYHDKTKGELLMEVRMEPGDLLYLPRGQYHAALADDGGAVHIAFGVTYPIGIDVVTLLFDRMIAEPAFRANLPRPDQAESDRALAERLAILSGRISAVLADPKTVGQIQAWQRKFRYPRHHYDLPDLLNEPVEQRYRVRAQGVRLVEQGGRFGLLRDGARGAVEVPAAVSKMVGWVLDRPQFTAAQLVAAFPQSRAPEMDKLLNDLMAMRLIEHA